MYLVFLRTERCSIFAHTQLRGLFFGGYFLGGSTYKDTILESIIKWYMIDMLSFVHKLAVFKPHTRRRAAGQAAAATQQPNIQSVLWCRTDGIINSKQQQQQIYLVVNLRQAADLFVPVLPTNTLKGVTTDSSREASLQQ